MKLLYVSCHSILEYDEIKLFAELGIDVFSYGSYRDPRNTDDPKRPALDLPFHKDLFDLTAVDDKTNIPQALIDWADAIMVMHRSDWLHYNWDKFHGKDVILRTIGQNDQTVERDIMPLRAQGLNIVRYSPREKTIPYFAGEDAMIRFYKDENEFKGWNGEGRGVLTIAQDMVARGDHCNFGFFEQATHDLPRTLIGKGSSVVGLWGKGVVSYEEMKKSLRECGLYFYTGTYPASYTLNFIEALMTGCPMVALGPKWGNSSFVMEQQTYEIPDFSENGTNILLADDVQTAMHACRDLLNDQVYAQQMSIKARNTALKYFSKEAAKKAWAHYFGISY
jgi:hypothetical protein